MPPINPYTGSDNGNDPIQQARHNYAGKDWERYLAFLNGKHLLPQNLGIGATHGLLPRPGEQDIARSGAINAYLGDLTDENAMRPANAPLDAVEAELRGLRDNQTVRRAAATANDPRSSAFGAPIVLDENGRSVTAPPVGQPPVNRQALAAQMAPGLIAAPAPVPPKPVTFDDPKPLMVNGKRTMTRAGSDGQLYTMDRKPITSGIAPDEPPAVSTVSDEGVELAARNYLTTGTMPPLGQGDKTTRQRILDRAAQLGGAGASISANKADYKADSGSLAAMQKQRDAIGAFEETAGKNIDIFLNTAGKIVDTGSPLMNTPLRAVTGKLLGSPDQAKYDAARQVAINEIAKITANPNLSGQLSDSARHEVEAFNPQGATLAQTVAVMRLLKQDMGNRVTSLDDRIKDVKGRLAGGDKSGDKTKDPLGIR